MRYILPALLLLSFPTHAQTELNDSPLNHHNATPTDSDGNVARAPRENTGCTFGDLKYMLHRALSQQWTCIEDDPRLPLPDDMMACYQGSASLPQVLANIPLADVGRLDAWPTMVGLTCANVPCIAIYYPQSVDGRLIEGAPQYADTFNSYANLNQSTVDTLNACGADVFGVAGGSLAFEEPPPPKYEMPAAAPPPEVPVFR